MTLHLAPGHAPKATRTVDPTVPRANGRDAMGYYVAPEFPSVDESWRERALAWVAIVAMLVAIGSAWLIVTL